MPRKTVNRIPHPAEEKARKAIGSTFGPEVVDVSMLDTFPYEYPGNPITMEHTTDEFSCLCPFNKMPDYARLTIRYVPDKACVELKSLKYYLYSFRQVKIYHEHVVNKILKDLVSILKPKELTVELKFATRGGISTIATAHYPNVRSR
ncbi:MAG: preQ(1) synthase [bacterium]|nr:preQ(1) synthase [bacterium]